MPILEVQHICKTFGDTQVLKDISFTLEKGEALSMIGTSGSGKTTLLRCLNFLETPTSGKILVNDKPVFDSETAGRMSEAQIRENRLHFGMVFQNFNLFPHFSLDTRQFQPATFKLINSISLYWRNSIL